MKRYLILGMLSLFFYSCKKEPEIKPIGEIKNWYEIKEGTDEWGKIAYDIYTKYGCSVYANDTIGHEIRGIDHLGNPIVHYETLRIGYSIETHSNIPIVLTRDNSKLLNGIKLVQERIMPLLKRHNAIPRSILLVDTLYTGEASEIFSITQKGLNTTIISLTMKSDPDTYAGINEYNEEMLDRWIGKVVASEITSKFIEKEKEKLQLYYQIQADASEREREKKNYFSSNFLYSNTVESNSPFFESDPRVLGFLYWPAYHIRIPHPRFPQIVSYRNYTPTFRQDIEDFLSKILMMKSDTFKEENQEYPIVLEKYAWLLAFAQEQGLDLR